jgi:hypothetical protein
MTLKAGTAARLKDESANPCTDKSCNYRDYTTNCDPRASRTAAPLKDEPAYFSTTWG